MKNTIHFTISFDITEKPTNYQGFKIMECNQELLNGAGQFELTAMLDNAKAAVKDIICKNLNTHVDGVLTKVENYKTLEAKAKFELSLKGVEDSERARKDY